MEKLSDRMVMDMVRVQERCKATPISKSKYFLNFSFHEIYSNISHLGTELIYFVTNDNDIFLNFLYGQIE